MNCTHGQAKRGQRSQEWIAWVNMRARCQNPKRPCYQYYGGRGIKVCQRWQVFENFFKDMGKKPSPQYSLDRIDNNGDYEPGNCRWATWKEQHNNQRPKSRGPQKQRWFHAISPQGETLKSNNQHEIARKFGLTRGDISVCLHGRRKYHKGWRFEWIEEVK